MPAMISDSPGEPLSFAPPWMPTPRRAATTLEPPLPLSWAYNARPYCPP